MVRTKKKDKASHLRLERPQAFPSVQDTARHQLRQHSALGKENWTKGVGTLTQESEPCAVIRVSRNQMQVQFGHVQEKAIPDEEPHIPAQKQEL